MSILFCVSFIAVVFVLIVIVRNKTRNDVFISNDVCPPPVMTEPINAPVMVDIVNRILISAIQARADKIEIVPGSSMTQVSYFIDGEWRPGTILNPRTFEEAAQGERSSPLEISKLIHTPMLRRLKVMTEIKYYDKNYPQMGFIMITISDRTYRLDLTIDQTEHVETSTINIVPIV